MEKKRLKELAGILDEGVSYKDTWTKFTKAAKELESMLRTVSIEDGGTKDRAAESINFEITNDIQYSIENVQKQLDRLDRVYNWRDYMKKKRERVRGK